MGPPPKPKPSPSPPSCPGGTLEKCMEQCPAGNYKACVAACVKNCPAAPGPSPPPKPKPSPAPKPKPAPAPKPKPPAPAPKPNPGQCSDVYKQCGGKDWKGPTCCDKGCTCDAHGPYYSQCVPPQGKSTCQ